MRLPTIMILVGNFFMLTGVVMILVGIKNKIPLIHSEITQDSIVEEKKQVVEEHQDSIPKTKVLF